MNPILILSGKGKTGRRVAARLDARDVPYRLASRSTAQPFDWYDESTWDDTLAGADTAYLAPPVGPTGLAQAGKFVEQARGLRRLVLLSGRGVGSPGRDFAVYDGQLALENVVRATDLDWTIVQPSWFAQGFSEDFLRYHVLAGEIRLSAGTGGEAWIDTDDVGDVMATALLDPRYVGQLLAISRPSQLLPHPSAGSAPRPSTDRDGLAISPSTPPHCRVRRPSGASRGCRWSVRALR